MKDKLIRIKRSRMKPEELFLIDILNNITIKKQTLYDDSIYWETDGIIMFIQNFYDNCLYVKHTHIWYVLTSTFCYSESDVVLLIESVVKKHMGWFGLTPVMIWTDVKKR